MIDSRWKPEDEAAWEDRARLAAEEAWNVWRRAGSPRPTVQEEQALRKALAEAPPQGSRGEGEQGTPGPCAQGRGGEAAPGNPAVGQRPSTRPRGSGSHRGHGLDSEDLLLWMLIFILWRERADWDVLLAIVYILLV